MRIEILKSTDIIELEKEVNEYLEDDENYYIVSFISTSYKDEEGLSCIEYCFVLGTK